MRKLSKKQMFQKCSGVDALTGNAVEVSYGEKITAVAPLPRPVSGLPYVAPGWIDLQVNGFAGVDYNDPSTSHEEVARSIREIFATGATRFLPTIITGSPDDMAGALANMAAAKESCPEGAAIEGFHVEGPYIAPEDGPRGAHPKHWVRPPSLDEFERMQERARGLIRLLTLSPQWDEAPTFIEKLATRGVTVSIGHTSATAEQIQAAVAAGATMSTHLGNGAHGVVRRHPNYIWEQLAEDRLVAGFIVDGIHLGKAFLKSAIRAKGVARSVLVTDASTPAGCRPGRYRMGEQELELTADDHVVLAGTDRLAGSALRMNRGVANLMRLAGLSLPDAVTMATLNPARAVGLEGRTRGFRLGERADIVVFRLGPDGSVEVEKTVLSGKTVFERRSGD